MSHDQKPARVRMVSGATKPVAPTETTTTATPADAATEAVVPVAGGKAQTLLPYLFFMVASLGGAAIAILLHYR